MYERGPVLSWPYGLRCWSQLRNVVLSKYRRIHECINRVGLKQNHVLEMVNGRFRDLGCSVSLLCQYVFSLIQSHDALPQRFPIGSDILRIVCAVKGYSPFVRRVLHYAEPSAHVRPPVIVEPRKVDQHVPFAPFVSVVELVSIVPIPRLEEDSSRKVGLVEDMCHCFLVDAYVEIDVWPKHRVGHGLCEHLDGPFVDVEEECPSIQTGMVFVSQEVDVREVGRWEEGFERYGWIEEY